jgi:hypothetical protein
VPRGEVEQAGAKSQGEPLSGRPALT